MGGAVAGGDAGDEERREGMSKQYVSYYSGDGIPGEARNTEYVCFLCQEAKESIFCVESYLIPECQEQPSVWVCHGCQSQQTKKALYVKYHLDGQRVPV